MSAESLVSSTSENGVAGKLLSLCDSETLDKRLPVRSIDAGLEMSSKIPRIISILGIYRWLSKKISMDTILFFERKKIYIYGGNCVNAHLKHKKKVVRKNQPIVQCAPSTDSTEFLSSFCGISGVIVPLKLEFDGSESVSVCVLHPPVSW